MTGQAWTTEQLAVLAARYANEPTASLAASIGRTASAVFQQARKLGLAKSQEYLASPAASHLRRGNEIGAEFRFKPGQQVWNKGIRFTPGGRSAETQFKLGLKPQTWHPVGTERITKDGILQRKVADTGVKNVDWRPVHVLVWESAYGPVPESCVIVFADRNKRNFDVSNLDCVDRAELMRRNSVHRLPKELAEVIQLRGAINRQINKGLPK